MIRSVQLDDASGIAAIYNHYILTSTATFEEQTVSNNQIAERIQESIDNSLPWLVSLDADGSIAAYAYASKWKGRCAYRFSVEVTVYADPNAQGKGLGTQLYLQLFELLKSAHIHTLIAGITLPNAASIGLHEKLGFKKVAHFEQIGFKFEQWLDTGYWQKQL